MDQVSTIRMEARPSWCRAITMRHPISCPWVSITAQVWAWPSSRASYAIASTSSSKCFNPSKSHNPLKESYIYSNISWLKEIQLARKMPPLMVILRFSSSTRAMWIIMLRLSPMVAQNSLQNLSAQHPRPTRWSKDKKFHRISKNSSQGKARV